MKRIIFFTILAISLCFYNNIFSQSIDESCKIIETEVKDGIYNNFSVNSNGFLTYNWVDKKSDSQTLITIDLTKVRITKDVSQRGYRVFINCMDEIDCINEKGRLSSNENYYSDFSKTYIPAKDEKGMIAIYNHLLFLLKWGNTNK
ncbi:MAG: hypothetical protein LBM25_01860 [Bacteroidales bacterium]|jgi:hypothetical protein|nr:hypothetical protein [Bacteroidales bacterium]